MELPRLYAMHVVRHAAEQFDLQGLTRPEQAESAFLLLWTLRFRLEELPVDLRAPFMEVWDSFGLPQPRKPGRSASQALIEAMNEEQLLRCKRLTFEFARRMGMHGLCPS